MTKPAPREDQGDERLEVEAPERAAAGLPAVVASLRHTRDQMGLRRGARTLLRLNQQRGLRLPGLRLARAAQDLTVRVLRERRQGRGLGGARSAGSTGAFFAEHPVSDLAERSEYWLGQQGRLTEPMHRPAGADHYEPISWDDAFALIAAS